MIEINGENLDAALGGYAWIVEKDRAVWETLACCFGEVGGFTGCTKRADYWYWDGPSSGRPPWDGSFHACSICAPQLHRTPGDVLIRISPEALQA